MRTHTNEAASWNPASAAVRLCALAGVVFPFIGLTERAEATTAPPYSGGRWLI